MFHGNYRNLWPQYTIFLPNYVLGAIPSLCTATLWFWWWITCLDSHSFLFSLLSYLCVITNCYNFFYVCMSSVNACIYILLRLILVVNEVKTYIIDVGTSIAFFLLLVFNVNSWCIFTEFARCDVCFKRALKFFRYIIYAILCEKIASVHYRTSYALRVI